MGGLQSELLKYKRTFMRKLIVFIPIFFAGYALIIQSTLMKNPLSERLSWDWQSLLCLVFNWWPMVFLPIGFALFASLAASQEVKAGNYRALKSHNISPAALWINKIAAMAFHSLLSTIILMVSTIFAGLFSKAGAVPIGQIAAAGLVCWVTSLVLIPIQLWAAVWKGLFLSMGIGFAGMIGGILTASNSVWLAVPWSWATRLMCPIVGVQPNGTVLSQDSPLRSTYVIPVGIAVSLAVFFAVTVCTAAWFQRREEQ